jgi:hypothetical protein
VAINIEDRDTFRKIALNLSLLASMVAQHIPASEVLVEVHCKEGALLPRDEAAAYIASHLGEGTIRIADRGFKSVVVVALNGVAAGWQIDA